MSNIPVYPRVKTNTTPVVNSILPASHNTVQTEDYHYDTTQVDAKESPGTIVPQTEQWNIVPTSNYDNKIYMSDLEDVDAPDARTGDSFMFNGTEWVPYSAKHKINTIINSECKDIYEINNSHPIPVVDVSTNIHFMQPSIMSTFRVNVRFILPHSRNTPINFILNYCIINTNGIASDNVIVSKSLWGGAKDQMYTIIFDPIPTDEHDIVVGWIKSNTKIALLDVTMTH